jgi:putative membrane protein
MPSDFHGASLFSSAFPVTCALAVAALLYWRGWYLLRETFPHAVSAWKLAAFISGLATLWIALGSPIAHLDHELLTAHMLQHLLLMTIAAPLIWRGAPIVTLLHAFPQRFVCSATRIFQTRGARVLGNVLAHPSFCWFAGTMVVIWWHIPFAFGLAMRSHVWHGLEQATFLAGGLAFWWPVVQPWPSLARWPRWSVPLYLFLATLPCDALSAFLTFRGHVVYSCYFSGHNAFDISPLQDQACAGALMWIWVTFAYLAPAVGITIQMLTPRVRAEIEVA